MPLINTVLEASSDRDFYSPVLRQSKGIPCGETYHEIASYLILVMITAPVHRMYAFAESPCGESDVWAYEEPSEGLDRIITAFYECHGHYNGAVYKLAESFRIENSETFQAYGYVFMRAELNRWIDYAHYSSRIELYCCFYRFSSEKTFLTCKPDAVTAVSMGGERHRRKENDDD